jgi:hypothetical protein
MLCDKDKILIQNVLQYVKGWKDSWKNGLWINNIHKYCSKVSFLISKLYIVNLNMLIIEEG